MPAGKPGRQRACHVYQQTKSRYPKWRVMQTGQGMRAILSWSPDASPPGTAARSRLAACCSAGSWDVAPSAAACAGAGGCDAASASAAALTASGSSSGFSCSRVVHRSFKHPALYVTGRSPSQIPNMHARQKLALMPDGNTL